MQTFQYLENTVVSELLEESEYKHQNVISLVSKTLAHLGYSESDIKNVILGVYLMDIGLHLNRNDETYEEHPVNGCIYIANSINNEIVKNIVLLHHENLNGTGFPFGLIGEEVPEYVQVVSIILQYEKNRNRSQISINDNINQLKTIYNEELVQYICEKILKKFNNMQ